MKPNVSERRYSKPGIWETFISRLSSSEEREEIKDGKLEKKQQDAKPITLLNSVNKKTSEFSSNTMQFAKKEFTEEEMAPIKRTGNGFTQYGTFQQ